MPCIHTRMCSLPGTHLTTPASRAVQHEEEEVQFTGQAELFAAEMIQESVSQRLYEVQHLWQRGGRLRWKREKAVAHLQHRVTIGIWNVDLQTSKLGVIIMSKVKRLDAYRGQQFRGEVGVNLCTLTQFGIFDLNLSVGLGNEGEGVGFWKPQS